MPLIPFPIDVLEAEVCDRSVAGTSFKQKARFVSLHAEQDQSTGVVTVHVRVRVSLYADDNGAYGPPLSGKGLSSYDVVLLADNNCAVDPASGAVLYQRVTETAEQWAALLEAAPEPLLLQGDWFKMLMDTQQVAISPLLRGFIEQANAAPYDKFAQPLGQP